MSEIIREIFRGNLDVFERPYSPDSKETAAFAELEELTAQIKESIPQEYHSQLERYQNSMLELMDAACEEEYLSGYQLGVRMMVAAWPDDPN